MEAPRSVSDRYFQTVLTREAGYEGLPAAKRLFRRMRRLREAVPRERLLDVGCGTGTLTEGFARLDFEAIGVDIVPDFIAAAQELHPDLRFETAAAELLPFDDASFDYVTLLSLLEHAEDWRQALREALRVLKPQGVAVVTTTNRWCPKQHEIKGFPAFGLYPDRVRRGIYAWAMERRPEWVGHTHRPAYHWLSFGTLAREFDSIGADAHHWLSLMADEDIPARLRRPGCHALVRFALRHPIPLTYPVQPTTFLYAQKR